MKDTNKKTERTSFSVNKRLLEEVKEKILKRINKGFYYCDVELKHGNDVTIERMITNLDMCGEEGWKKY